MGGVKKVGDDKERSVAPLENARMLENEIEKTGLRL